MLFLIFVFTMEEELRAKFIELDERYHELQELIIKAREEREAAMDALHKEQVKKMGDVIPTYTTKLERLKAYISAFDEVARGTHCRVNFAFRKVDGYTDDFHEPMHDPLDWKIAEYNLIGMSDHVEIIFDYSNETVKEFVKRWMFENIKDVCFEDDIKELFGFRAV